MEEVSRYSVHRQATIRTTVCGVDRATDRAPRWVRLCYRGYLLKQFAATPAAHDPRRGELIASVLEDFGRLSAADAARTGQHHVRDHFTIRRFEHDAAVANLSREAIAKSADRKRRRPIHPSKSHPLQIRTRSAALSWQEGALSHLEHAHNVAVGFRWLPSETVGSRTELLVC